MVNIKKGGSPASDFIESLNVNNGNSSKKINRLIFPKCNTNSKFGVSKVSSGGSPLSSVVNFFVKRRSNLKKKPGVCPRKSNDYNLLKLSPPIYKNGILQGGSAWKAVHNSSKAYPSQKDKELFKKFSKDAKLFTQRLDTIINGPMFKPFGKTKKKMKNSLRNTKNNRKGNKSKKGRYYRNNRVEYGRVNRSNKMNSIYAVAKNNSAKNNSAKNNSAKNNSAKNNSAKNNYK